MAKKQIFPTIFSSVYWRKRVEIYARLLIEYAGKYVKNVNDKKKVPTSRTQGGTLTHFLQYNIS